MSGHLLRERVAEIAALDREDPERRTAEAHAAECGDCRRALAEAEQVFALLDAMAPPPAPTQAVMARALAAVHAEMDAAPAPVVAKRRARLPVAVAVAATWTLSLAVARHRDDSGMAWSAGGAAVATLLALYAVSRGALVLAAIAVASIGFALLAGSPGALDPDLGVRCAAHEVVSAFIPLGVTAWLALSKRAQVGPLGYAAAAATGAAAGQAALHLSCPDAHATPHLLAFHAGGVLIAAVLGAALSYVPRLRATT